MQPTDNLLNQAGGDPADIRQLYDRWAGDYDRNLAAWGYEAPAVAAARLRVLAGGAVSDLTVLDVGCGTGLTGRALQAACFSIVDGVDLSEASLAEAEKGGIYRRLTAVDFTRLPTAIGENAYDALFCVGVLSYLPDTEAVCREFCRLTKPGGAILLTQRSDIFAERDDAKAFAALEAAGHWQIVEITEPMPYLPGNPEFEGIGVHYCAFRRAGER